MLSCVLVSELPNVQTIWTWLTQGSGFRVVNEPSPFIRFERSHIDDFIAANETPFRQALPALCGKPLRYLELDGIVQPVQVLEALGDKRLPGGMLFSQATLHPDAEEMSVAIRFFRTVIPECEVGRADPMNPNANRWHPSKP